MEETVYDGEVMAHRLNCSSLYRGICLAYEKGRAVAKTCHRELAELYEERLRETRLTVSIEPTR
jgi:hypothetical protein